MPEPSIRPTLVPPWSRPAPPYSDPKGVGWKRICGTLMCERIARVNMVTVALFLLYFLVHSPHSSFQRSSCISYDCKTVRNTQYKIANQQTKTHGQSDKT